MVWGDKLQNHINLSETHAENYDSNYGSIVTKKYMMYEESRIHLACDLLGKENRGLAVDVGCGTGRCTIDLSKYFEKVIGIDFSPKMIEVAAKNACRVGALNTEFYLKNVSTVGLGDFSDKVQFLNFAFGMGSFIEDIEFLIAEIKRVLTPGGVFYITFYNKESFVYKMADTVDMGISAIPSKNKEELIVDGIGIPCKYYSPNELKILLGKHFREVSFVTYPTILPLIKEPLLLYTDIVEYCEKLENNTCNEDNGYYISAVYQYR